MTAWMVKVSSVMCPYREDKECQHKKMMEKQQTYNPVCRKKDCPIRVKTKKKVKK